MLQEQSPCLLQPQLKHVWFCVLAQGGLLWKVMLVALGQRKMGRCWKHHYASLRVWTVGSRSFNFLASPDRRGRAGTLPTLQGNFVGANKSRHLGHACQAPKDNPADSCKEQEEGEVW